MLCAAGNDKKAKKAIDEESSRLEKKKQSKNVLLEGDLEMMLTQRVHCLCAFLGISIGR